MLVSPFNKVEGPKAFIKKRFQLVFSCEIREVIKNTYFEEHIRKVVSESSLFAMQMN